MEADLLHFYGVDLVDWYRGTISTRRVVNLVWQLPQESAFMSMVNDRPRWSFADERLMDVPEAFTGKTHPIRKSVIDAQRKKRQAPAREAALRKAQAHRKKFNKK